MPESYCLKIAPQLEIYPCHLDQHGAIKFQIARCAAGSDQ